MGGDGAANALPERTVPENWQLPELSRLITGRFTSLSQVTALETIRDESVLPSVAQEGWVDKQARSSRCPAQ